MKKKSTLPLLALLAFLFLLKNVEAQTQRAVVTIEPQHLYQFEIIPSSEIIIRPKASPFYQVPLTTTGQFLAYSVVWYSNKWDDHERGDRLAVSFAKGNDGLDQVNIAEDGHSERDSRRHVSELYFLENGSSEFRLGFTGTAKIDSIVVHFFDPGPTLKPQTSNPNSPIPQLPNSPTSDRSVCTCPQPAFQGRLGWCPDGSCPTDPTPEFVADPTHVIVHHTAGTNIASDWAAIVRSIWDFHVNANGWDDIGYNWLVDPNGVLYEGRGDGRLGAHFCAQNGNTTGICVMGDFTDIQPTGSALNTLEDFLAWETCDENIDPLGTGYHTGSGMTLPFISGHRDGCNTSCPGDMLYPLLPGVRTATQDKITSGCDFDALAAPTVLAITFVGATKISLSWQDNAVGETAYILERSVNNNGNYSTLIQLPANATAFSDNSVTPGKTYFYRVRAKKSSEFSAYSNEAVAVTGVSASASRLLNGRTVQISPNPTNGKITLTVDNQWIGATELAVFDVVGKMVVTPFSEGKTSEKANLQLDLSGFSSGIFIVRMVQGADVGWFRVVKN
ncbi:MAG: N-acetylmuramoyl-L-alanine amidase [Bacteroidales bacterium]|nr:N-acetylmuramoyl-L-alanine amidase [Bacteroidales bacterium]